MKKLIIVGAGALGRQVLSQLYEDVAIGHDWIIKGFLDERLGYKLADDLGVQVIGSAQDYQPGDDEIFVSALADPKLIRRQCLPLRERGAEFVSVRTRCQIGQRTKYGASFFGYDVAVGVDTKIGDFCFLERDIVLGHDVLVGNCVSIGMRSIIAGYVEISDDVVIHPGAMIARDLKIGTGAVIGMGAVVFANVPAGQTMLGNPARVFRFKQE